MRCTALYGFRIICTHIMLFWERQQFLSNENPQAAKLRLPMSTVAAGCVSVCCCTCPCGQNECSLLGRRGCFGHCLQLGRALHIVYSAMYVCMLAWCNEISLAALFPPPQAEGVLQTHTHDYVCQRSAKKRRRPEFIWFQAVVGPRAMFQNQTDFKEK